MAETIHRDTFYQGRPGYEGMLNTVRLVACFPVKIVRDH